MPKKLTIETARSEAQKRGGECLSDIYVNNVTKLRWRCNCGYEWESPLVSVRNRDRWCSRCAGCAKLSIDDARNVARGRGGECLSEKYVNTDTKMLWKCSQGHEWKAKLNHIKDSNSWCPRCAAISHGEASRSSIKGAKEIALGHGGECLSKIYEGARKKLRWRCAKGHEWEANYSNVAFGGKWCPNCLFKGESLTRDIIERLTKHQFPKTRQKLYGNRELDGYCEELRVAFEYNGIQHYEYVPHFHRNGEIDLQHQKEIDVMKQEWCDELEIALIWVPYDTKNLKSLLYKELELLGVLANQTQQQ